jgi:hypothetical protein
VKVDNDHATKRKHGQKLDQLDERIGDTLVSGVGDKPTPSSNSSALRIVVEC